MTIKDSQLEIIEEFSVFSDWMDKYEYLIELGKALPDIAVDYKVQENLIEGCQSRVWLNAELEGDVIKFSADSDAIITKGLIALLIRVLNNQSPAEVMNADLFFIDKIGLSANLSPTRSNGLASMLKQVKWYALAYKTKLEKR